MLFYLFQLFSVATASHTCNVLSLSGGGAYGVNEIAIMRSLQDKGQLGKFDIVTGISAGGLNAGFLSYYDNITEGLEHLQSMYINMRTDDIYKKSMFGIFHLLKTWGFYDTSPLENFLNTTLHALQIYSRKTNRKTFVGTTNLDNGKLEIFEFNKYNVEEQLNLLLSTSAIPILFKPVYKNNVYYVDGGLIANEMIEEVFEMTHSKCDKYTYTIVLSNTLDIDYEEIHGLLKYVERLLDVVARNFDSDLNRIQCDGILVSMRICYPNYDLSKYSHLNFNNGKEMYEKAYHYFTCKQYC